MTQHQIILDALQDQKWHCSNELRELYVPEYRSRINELRKRGYVIEKVRCTIHQHKGVSQMWRLNANSAPQRDFHPLEARLYQTFQTITAPEFLAKYPSKGKTPQAQSSLF